MDRRVTPTALITIRVPQGLADAIQADADGMGMTRNEVLNRRLKGIYRVAREVQKKSISHHKQNEGIEWPNA